VQKPGHVAHPNRGKAHTFSKSGDKGKTLVNPKIWHANSSWNKEASMAQERLTVKKIKEILRLKHGAGLSNRAIAGVGWPLGELSEDELYQKMFGEQPPLPEKVKPLPDWEEVRKELRKKGVTLHLIWIEYIEK